MANEHVKETLPGYVLGCLDEDENEQVAAHLPTCAKCREELEAYRAVAERLTLAVASDEPPPEVKERLMACIEQRILENKRQLEVPGPVRWSLPRLWRVVFAVLIVALVAGNVWWWLQTSGSSLPGDQAASMRVVTLTGSDTARPARGLLVMSTDGERGTLIVEGLPALDPVRQYQLWLIDGSRRDSGAVFSVDGEGYASIDVSAAEPLPGYLGFGVTVEPAGGSHGPTGPRVLGTSR